MFSYLLVYTTLHICYRKNEELDDKSLIRRLRKRVAELETQVSLLKSGNQVQRYFVLVLFFVIHEFSCVLFSVHMVKAPVVCDCAL